MRRTLTVCLMLTLGMLPELQEGSAQEVDDGLGSSATIIRSEDSDAPATAVSNQDESDESASLTSDDTDDPTSALTPPIPALGEQTQSNELPAPDVYLLPDKNGKLRKVLGFRYEDFFDAWRREKGGKEVSPPAYVIDSWDVSGNASESRVDVNVKFDIVTQSSNWVNVPIQLPELILQQVQIDDQQTGECLVYDQQQHGYTLWLRAEPGSTRSVELTGMLKLTASNGTKNLEVHLPRGVKSSFVVNVPGDSARFESSPELKIETTDRENSSTEVRLYGQANPLQLRWTVDTKRATSDAAPLAIEEETIAQVSRRSATYETMLRVNTFGRPSDRIRVRLPRRATLKTNAPQNDYQISKLPSTEDEDQGQLIEIRLPKASTKPWSVNLIAERAIESFGDAAECRLGGFEVINAFQQSGTITLQVDDQLQAYFDHYGEIEQIPFGDTPTSTSGRFTLGRFRYTRFPWQLVVFTSPRQRRVSVEPSYDLEINAEEARLDVEYDYQLTGAQMFSLRLDLHGWTLTDDPIDSGGAIDLTRVVERNEGRLILPLVDENRQQLSVQLSLKRNIRFGENTFSLPEPLDAFITDGELAVESLPSLLVSPQSADMQGLSVIANSSELVGEPSAVQNTENRILLRTFLPQPIFSAEITQRKLELAADLQTSVEVDQQVTRVFQAVTFRADYKPVTQLALTLPEELRLNETLRLSLAGEQLPFALSTVTESDASEAADEPPVGGAKEARVVVVSLPRPMINEIPLELAYELATPSLEVAELSALELPLATPTDLPASHTVEIRTTDPVLVTLNQRTGTDDWNVVPGKMAAEYSTRDIKLRAEGNQSRLSLYAQIDTVDSQQLATLQRAWIQTWIAPGQRQQRAVFRFRTPNENVFVKLPAELDSSEVELLLDGKPSAFQLLANSRLSLALAKQGVLQSHTLEVRYQTDSALLDFASVQFEFPQLECRIASAPIYWQLILPPGWQALQAPENLIPDYRLGWRHYRWGRQPSLSQADLEQITGAVASMPPAPLAPQYIYRAFEFPANVEVKLVRQMWLFVGAAVATFLLGLLCLYTPMVWNGWFWLGLSLVFLVGIFSYPEVTLLAIEVVLVGGLMTFVALVLRRIFTLNNPSHLNLDPTSFHAHSSEATEPWQRRIASGPVTSETTATLRAAGRQHE